MAYNQMQGKGKEKEEREASIHVEGDSGGAQDVNAGFVSSENLCTWFEVEDGFTLRLLRDGRNPKPLTRENGGFVLDAGAKYEIRKAKEKFAPSPVVQ
eukprot:CAMPEP_0201509112 /NCGR_PEP_ID=MMETSP0161_2-20130828/2253_1 /ASSEMBLY_ACC=CAM_ASM_000251 /TAXON_ID=180227 /ORGANISM="Neoparamoeba aestuarina, Strain SoJaBio B1-5/56/2" /LENGTH=97 /DNA_ID=CAMNT_0047903965 /DNA_START=51 /DNA_END=344 /DNA_ORIENTATION=-